MISKEKVLDWLRIMGPINAYLIKAIINNRPGFRYEIKVSKRGSIIGLTAYWDDEGVICIRERGTEFDKSVSSIRSKYPNYELLDLELDVVEKYLENKTLELGQLQRNDYELMVYDQAETEHRIKSNVSKITYEQWVVLKKEFREKYQKDLSDYDIDLMTYYGIKHKNQWISLACIEQIDEDLLFLSNVYVVPEFRRQGIAYKMIKELLEGLENKKIGLFVSTSKVSAINLYKKIGFSSICKTVCFEK